MKSIVSDISIGNAAPVALALNWVAPWSRRRYPGHFRAITQILERRITYASVQHWRKGRRAMSVADAARLRVHIAARLAEGQAIVAGLDQYIMDRLQRPRRLHGCCIVGDDRQGRRPQWRG